MSRQEDNERLRRILSNPSRFDMVGWYDPPVLARSAILLTIANIFGRHSDRRLLEALATQPQGSFDYSGEQGDFWIDYVSDLGDGWNSTYAIARSIAQSQLDLPTPGGEVERTSGGQVLIYGGDVVYPYPSRAAYELRTEKPYALAFLEAGRCPDIFAVPGNHDWYDSLIAFSRTFCRPERGFAGCRTQQTRSYFALRLPANWWLLAIDLQLGADLDEPQVSYFQRIAEEMGDEARIILCVPEPQWLFEEKYPEESTYEDVALKFLEHKILKRPVQVFLSGDVHQYKRHESPGGIQKIISGGGGAFLHPTHVPRAKTTAGDFEERIAYPDRALSSRLAWRNLLFPLRNPKFFWLPALLYALSAWFASASLTPDDLATMPDALRASAGAAIRDPFNGLWLLAFITGIVFFTDTHVKWYRLLAGVTHALAHLAAAFAIGWFALVITTDGLGLAYGTVLELLLAGVITFIVGGFVGSLIIGCYLLISLQLFGRHSEQAFSALRVQDYKNWLRLRIDAEGTLTIHAIGIDRVPRKWKSVTGIESAGISSSAPGSSKAVLEQPPVPDDPRATPPRLIEKVRLAAARRNNPTDR